MTTFKRSLPLTARRTRRALVLTTYLGYLGMVLAWSVLEQPLRWLFVLPLGFAAILAMGLLLMPQLLGISEGADEQLDERQVAVRNRTDSAGEFPGQSAQSEMLRPTAIPEVPAETARIARAAFPKGAPFLCLRDELGVFLTDQDFVHFYPQRGQPAAAPWRLMLISVMQYAENLTDRQAADAVRGHLAWKYALSLELDDPGLDASVLCEFRTRLLAAPEPLDWLDRLLSLCADRGLLQRHGKQRTDSTHVLAAIRVMNRLELVTECLRAALNALAAFTPDWLRETADPEWYDRYGHRMENYRFPKSDRGKQVYADQVGKDGQTLLALIARDDAPQGSQHLSEVLTLERCWQRQFTDLNGVIRFRLRSELVKERTLHVESPYDPEARYSTKRGREWRGYKVHVSETCDDGLPYHPGSDHNSRSAGCPTGTTDSDRLVSP